MINHNGIHRRDMVIPSATYQGPVADKTQFPDDAVSALYGAIGSLWLAAAAALLRRQPLLFWTPGEGVAEVTIPKETVLQTLRAKLSGGVPEKAVAPLQNLIRLVHNNT